ncbi:MAG TPA: glycoside hydrolase family 16 protein [Chitinispirillaceae bacterium]|nr:glycoside hydrolase family 16 protein [Chitinispirillaceae bacterium]
MRDSNRKFIAAGTVFLSMIVSVFQSTAQPSYENYKLVWADEFDGNGLPSSGNWDYEVGFVRNKELQYYTKQRKENVRQEEGNLIIEARRDNWEGHEYTAASLFSRGKREFQYGIFEMRAKIDIRKGSWPAFWTLGVSGEWPGNGEVDIMEYYAGLLHANVAWATSTRWQAHWSSKTKSVNDAFAKEYHIWRMHWTKDKIDLYVDDFLQNTTSLSTTINDSDKRNPFHQKAYIMINQAIGSNGGDPSQTTFPVRYYIDYIRVYQPASTIIIGPDSRFVPAKSDMAVFMYSLDGKLLSKDAVSGNRMFNGLLNEFSNHAERNTLARGVYIMNTQSTGCRQINEKVLKN